MKLKIKHKLFSALFLNSVVVAIGIFLFLQWNFDRGFLNYVNSQEKMELNQLAERLAKQYAKHNNWQFMIENHNLWRQLHAEVQPIGEEQKYTNGPGSLHTPPPPQENRPPHRIPPQRDRFDSGTPPVLPAEMEINGNSFSEDSTGPFGRMAPPLPNRRPEGLGPRIILFDANKERIIGKLSDARIESKLHPFSYQDKVIGYLGLVPLKELSDAGDLLFVEQQTASFAIITAVMVVFSLLVSFSITSHLLRPINELIEGTRKLIAGWFSTRIPVRTSDELGILSGHFNNLALTLEENEKARQLWVADISHELRTPLAILQGEVEAIQDGIQSADEQSLEMLHSEILHLGRLVNDLYELSMTDIGAMNYKKTNVDPIGILRDTIEFFENSYSKKGLNIEAAFPAQGSFSLLADPDRLQQLFTNLLENSLRYTNAPGVLKITIEEKDLNMLINFKDSAPSPLPEQLPKLFDRLFRGDESRNRSKGGAGLGMAICKNIVEAHQGSIEAKNSSLGGLWVRIVMPLTY